MAIPQGRFLVVRGGAIGDFILTLPVCSALRTMFPDGHVEILGYPSVTQLALDGGAADGVRNIDARPMTGFFMPKAELDEDLAAYFGSFNVVISYLYDPDMFFQKNVRKCGDHIQFIQGIHKPEDEDGIHATEAMLKALEIMAIFDADPKPRLKFDVAGGPEPLLAVHPGSGSPKKNWPINCWFELLRELGEKHRILIVGGEAEGEQISVLRSALAGDRFEFLEKRPLTEVGARLQACRGFVGHDSGISHLAAAVGLPGICLWGETTERVWRPRSDRFEVVHGGSGLEGIDVGEVATRVEKLMNG